MTGLRGTLIAAAIALLLGLLLLGQCQKMRTAGAQATLNGKTANAQADAGRDAVNAVAGAAERQADADQITRENARAIHEAAGSGQLVDPAVSGAGIVGLCRRAAYRGDTRCMRFTPATGMETGSAGRAAARE